MGSLKGVVQRGRVVGSLGEPSGSLESIGESWGLLGYLPPLDQLPFRTS